MRSTASTRHHLLHPLQNPPPTSPARQAPRACQPVTSRSHLLPLDSTTNTLYAQTMRAPSPSHHLPAPRARDHASRSRFAPPPNHFLDFICVFMCVFAPASPASARFTGKSSVFRAWPAQKMVTKWSPNGHQMVPKSSPNGPLMVTQSPPDPHPRPYQSVGPNSLSSACPQFPMGVVRRPPAPGSLRGSSGP